MTLRYAADKFDDAMYILATSPKSIQERVAAAFMLGLGPITAEDLPEQLHNDFHSLHERLTRVIPVGNEGSILATIHEMSDDDAVNIAKQIRPYRD